MAKKVTCAECGAKSQITDPDDDALEREVVDGEVIAGLTWLCPKCLTSNRLVISKEKA